MLVAICNRLFQIGSETRTIEIDDSIVPRYAPNTGRDQESYTEVYDVCLSRPIILDVQLPQQRLMAARVSTIWSSAHLELRRQGQILARQARRQAATSDVNRDTQANCPTIAMNASEFGRANQSDHHVL
jgi:hypothetical protein